MRLIQLQVNSTETSYPTSVSCLLQVVPPLGLTLLHPPLQNGNLYLQPSNTRLLLRVQSRYLTRASQHGSNFSVTFQPECPPEFSSSPSHCKSGPSSGAGVDVAEPYLYAVLDLNLVEEDQESPVLVELEATSNVTEDKLVVAVHLEKPLRGLVVQPHPACRVLMETLVVSVRFCLKC